VAEEATSQSAGETQATEQTSGASQSANTSQGNQTGPTTQAASQQTTAPGRPEYVPEAHWDATAGKIKDDKAFSAHLNEIISRDAAERIRKSTLPASPDAYKSELPKDFTPPAGLEFKLNESDPILAQARTLAHEMGIGQEGFSKLLGLYAGSQISTQQSITAARDAEIAKLGATGPARIDALSTFFTAQLGGSEGKQFMSRILTASDVAIAEKLVAKIANSGGNFTTRGREAQNQSGVLSDEQYAKLSPAARLDYARSRDQSKMPQWRDPRAA